MSKEKVSRGNGPFIASNKILPLFWICWFAYFAANMGRLSYTVSLAEILNSEGMTKSAGGLVSTGFFICYGVGQLFSGFLGDKISPKYMETFGLVFTALCNLLMAFAKTPTQMLVFWCINGIVQSTLWPPIIRIISEYFPPERRKKACVNISTTYPVATLLSYALSALIIWLVGWKLVFISCAVFIFIITVLWFVFFGRMDKYRTYMPQQRNSVNKSEIKKETVEINDAGSLKKSFPVFAIIMFCAALISQGALRDGLMTWVSPYLTETFGIGTSSAILFTGILPVVNLAGVYGTNFLYGKVKSESTTCLILFSAAAVSALGLLFLGKYALAVSIIFFSLVTACMMGINLMLVNIVPTYFVRQNKVAFMSGLTNSMVYLGSSISTYGIGIIADSLGWGAMLLSIVVLAVIGIVFILFSIPSWKSFLKKEKV